MDSTEVPDRDDPPAAVATPVPDVASLDGPTEGLAFTVLGCSGTFAGPGRACSGYLVRTATTTLVVDLGSGTLANLQRHVDLADVDAVVLSHEHPDHWLDLPLLRNAMRYVLGFGDLPVYGTAGTRRLAEGIISELAPTLVWTDVDASADVAVGDLRVRFSRTDHPVETLAMRVDGAGRSVLYTADTGARWDPRELGDGVDVLVSEASLDLDHEGRFEHLSGRQAGDMAARAGARRLVITHVVPDVDREQQVRDAATRFAGPIELAVEGRTTAI